MELWSWYSILVEAEAYNTKWNQSISFHLLHWPAYFILELSSNNQCLQIDKCNTYIGITAPFGIVPIVRRHHFSAKSLITQMMYIVTTYLSYCSLKHSTVTVRSGDGARKRWSNAILCPVLLQNQITRTTMSFCWI